MTVANYNSSIFNSSITVDYTGRDGTVSVVKMINQETKKVYFLQFQGYSTAAVIDISPLIDDGITKENTFSVILLDFKNTSLYRDIVVFDDRVNNITDYQQNEETETGYVFG